MSDLNVTKGEWTVTKYGYEKYSINGENGKEVASTWLGDNAYLIKQAKNMYEQLQRTDKLLKESNLDRKLGCKLSDEINEILNACKSPEE